MLNLWQNHFRPRDPHATRAMLELFLPSFRQHPVLTVAVLGAMAGVCEETLSRGPLQTALVRRLPAWLALGIGSFLFAAAHGDPEGMLFRTLLGMLLGWLVLRTGLIFPAMGMHAVVDWIAFGGQAWALRRWGSERVLEMAAHPRAAISVMGANLVIAALAVGAALLLSGVWLCRRDGRRT